MLKCIEEPLEQLNHQKIADAERTLNVKFPDDYIRFLLQYNGGRPEPEGFDIHWRSDQPVGEDWRTSMVSWFLSIYDGKATNLLTYNQVDFKDRIPKNTIAIAHDPGGNLILLGIMGQYAGKVLFWVKDYEVEEGEVLGYDNVGFLADSFDEFINSKLR